MSQHAVFCEFNGQRQRIGTATQAEDGSFVVVLGGFLVIGKAEAGPQPATTRPASGGGSGAVFPPYGRNKGQPIYGAAMEQLEWYAANAVRSINDPAKSRWRDKETALLAALNAEIVRQGGSPVGDGEAPQQGDRYGQTEEDSIPF